MRLPTPSAICPGRPTSARGASQFCGRGSKRAAVAARKEFIMRNTVLALALAAMLAGSSLQAEPPLVDRLPADATVYVGWAGRNLAFDGSMLGQMLNQPVMKELAGSIGGAILSALPDEQSRALAGHGLAMLSIAVQHTMALCMTDLTPAGTPPGTNSSGWS